MKSESADTPELRLNGFQFGDLFDTVGLNRLDQGFLQALGEHSSSLHQRLHEYRDGAGASTATELSELLLSVAPLLEGFLASLFGIERECALVGAATRAENVVAAFRQEFVQKRARHYRASLSRPFADLDELLGRRAAGAHADREKAVAAYAMALLEDEAGNAQALEELVQWCVLALKDPRGRHAVTGWGAFELPAKVNYAHLVPVSTLAGDSAGRVQGAPERRRRRDGFALTDERMAPRDVQMEINYCVYCHGHDGDFCSKGFPAHSKQPALGLKVNPLGEYMTGCPLEEKISEMHMLKRDGYGIAALAMAMVDNPMVPATGHRICNDCMKACIYQKQDPVDIPQIETRVLTDVLALPWGVELYDLLTRWNPLRREQYLPMPYNGRAVLVAGMGPAGFTMAHHLTMEGCAVVGIDGLKIEPLPEDLVAGPVRDWSTLVEELDERVLAGFGGVAEYGITSRWDKNFLKLIYLSLQRRPLFQVFGGVRLGGTVTVEDAWREGFDHLCIATGAGLPRVVPMGNSLARGMRQANDFLMALQLTGAAKRSSLANLQVRMPAVVIGGGLTAFDTATEVQAYYVVQVEKTLDRYERLSAGPGEQYARSGLDEENTAILDELLNHGREVREERQRAATVGEPADFTPLLRRWGGVTLAYRRGLNESPAYLRNHEEVLKALEEGVYFAEALDPVRAELDEYGHVCSMVFRRRQRSDDGRWMESHEEVTLPARSVFVAAGAAPNTVYESEHPGTFQLEGRHFLPHVCHADRVQPVRVADHAKSGEFGPFTSYHDGAHQVTFLGDTHPVFHGSVVKAIASAKRSYPYVMKALARYPEQSRKPDNGEFRAHVSNLLQVRVETICTDDPAIIEIWVRAPLAARNYRPGQFFRLQTFERISPVVEGSRLQIPVATVSGTGVKGDLVRLMLLPFGPVPRIAARLRPGDPLVLMGPTGAPAHLPIDGTVLVIGGQWGSAVMLDLGPALRKAGNKVLYLAAYGNSEGVYAKSELERATDKIIWCTAQGVPVQAGRDEDLSLASGDVIDVLRRWGAGELQVGVSAQEVDQVFVMGSTGLLNALQGALCGELSECFREDVDIVGTAGSPMQCMLKGVCGQCLQWQIDPDTGQRTRAVFSCAMQDQPLQWLDLDNLAARQAQNRLAENLTGKWLDHLLENAPDRQ